MNNMPTFKDENRLLFRFLKGLILLIAASATYLYITYPAEPQKEAHSGLATTTTDLQIDAIVQEKIDADADPLVPSSRPKSPQPPAREVRSKIPEKAEKKKTDPANQIQVSLQADAQDYRASLPAGKTVIDLMRVLASQGFRFSGQEYSGMGIFVEDINGRRNDPDTGFYWILYINGKVSQQGASSYKLKDGDAVTWKYEIPDF